MKKTLKYKSKFLIVSLLIFAFTLGLFFPVSELVAEENKYFEKYDPPIEISFVRAVDDDTTSNILPKTPGETIESNRWLDLYSEELGIDVTYDWTVKGGLNDDAYMQKINMTITSGDLPDVICVNKTQLKQLAEADQIANLTEIYEEYASDMTKDVLTAEPGLLQAATFDGKLMGIAQTEASVEGTQYLWLKTNWLENLNLEPPETMQDLLEISRAFTHDDPDGNGVDDTYGMVITKDLYSGAMATQGFFAGFHAYPNFWQTLDDGSLAWGSVQPEVKDALEALAEMYADGQLDPEFVVKDFAKAAEDVAAGKFGICFGEQWAPMHPLINDYLNHEEAD